MLALVVTHAGLGEAALGRDVTVDPTLRLLPPRDVESRSDWEEVEARIWKVVVNPPSHLLPVGSGFDAICKAWHYDASRGSHATLGIPTIPDVAGIVGFVARAVQPILIAEVVDGRRAVRGADSDPAECCVQRFEEVLAKPGASFDREVWVLRDVGQAVQVRDLAIEKISHEEILRQPNATEVVEFGD